MVGFDIFKTNITGILLSTDKTCGPQQASEPKMNTLHDIWFFLLLKRVPR